MSDNRCFAYNKSKQRCDLEGGHAADHSIIMSWTDEECYDPTAPVELTLKTYDTLIRQDPKWVTINAVPENDPSLTPEMIEEVAAMGPVPTYGEGTPGRCVLCNHRMHGGECANARCDCRAGIPG